MFLGVPTALWGALANLSVAILALLGLEGGKWRAALVLASGAVGFSAYLTFLSITQVGATCVYCLVSAGLSVLLLVALLVRRPSASAGLSGFSLAALGGGAAVAAVVIGAFVFAAGPEGATPYQLALARHLAQSKAVFYGAFWCPHCQEQKHKFGGAAALLPYVECDPKGTNSQTARCERAGVQAFPTWVIGSQRFEGVRSLEALAEASGFPKKN
jgi:thiol-disulfide isomerase/thioredoxin